MKRRGFFAKHASFVTALHMNGWVKNYPFEMLLREPDRTMFPSLPNFIYDIHLHLKLS